MSYLNKLKGLLLLLRGASLRRRLSWASGLKYCCHMSGASLLSPPWRVKRERIPGLAIAREVFGWRDGFARRVNRPPRMLLRDDLIVEIARRAPRTLDDLQSLRGLPRGEPEAIARARGLVQESDPSALRPLVEKILAAHPGPAEEFRASEEFLARTLARAS